MKRKLHGNWRITVLESTIEFYAPFLQRRLRISGITKRQGEGLQKLLRCGLDIDNGALILSEHIGLSLAISEKLLWDLDSCGAFCAAQTRSVRVDEMYDRQVRFLDEFSRGSNMGTDYNDRLQASTVVVVGLGGYGTWITLLCNRIGIRKIIGIDSDRIERSNLSRQILYDERSIGENKLDSAARTLLLLDVGSEFTQVDKWITTCGDLMPYLNGANLVFNTFGLLGPATDAGLSSVIAEACMLSNVPCLTVGAPILGPLTIPGETACIKCALSDSRVAGLREQTVPVDPKYPLPSFAPRVAMMASAAVWEASRFLSGADRSPAVDGIVILDSMDYSGQTVLQIARNVNCDMCGQLGGEG
jgi:molybdopterin-synthase adenylyltransferase